MKKKLLGQTGIEVSMLGLGTVKFGRNQQVHYPEVFDLPDDQHILTLLSLAAESGINLLDTAPAYGISEERLGKLLKNQRQQWVIATKAGEEFVNGQSHYDFSRAAITASIERSLKHLHTDYLDIVLIHSNGEDEKIIQQMSVFDTLNRCREMGKIRAYGMSTKTVAGGLLTIEQADLAMVTYNPLHLAEQAVIDAAHEKNKGIFIKKAFASGHLNKITGDDPVHTAIKCILQQSGVSSLILGTINHDHLRHNIACAEEFF